MDYGRLNRKELQALCKEHCIPANKTNTFMAEALGALLNGPKGNEQSVESFPDLAEVAKSEAKLKRAVRSKAVADVLEAREVDDLSSQLAKSTLAAEAACNDMFEGIGESLIKVPSVLEQESEVVAEPAKVPRKGRKQSANTKSVTALSNDPPALVEPSFEVVLEMENTIDPLASATPNLTSEYRTYSRVPKVREHEQREVVTLTVGSASLESGMPSEEITTPTVTLSPAAEIVEEETVNIKETKSKGKRSKKVSSNARILIPIVRSAIVASSTNNTSSTAPIEVPESPTLGLTSDVISHQEIQRAASINPAPGDEAFEFHPVPESFAEIMTPAKPIVEATKECQHRLGRYSGKVCQSCTSEKKVASPMQEMLQAIEVPRVDVLNSVTEAEETEVHTTPVKQDDKENTLKNIDLQSLSIRKLQKEVRKRGLSKRNNTKVTAEIQT